MARRIRPIERVKSRVVRVALKVFMAQPSLGKCQAKALFAEIFTHLQSGMDDEQVVQAVINSHTSGALPGRLSSM
ncbi:MAG: hypothetical protein Q8O64_17675 [Sideroxyarcus sp.]|nr:hypothetical protein [Sideroxyarcus sp.]